MNTKFMCATSPAEASVSVCKWLEPHHNCKHTLTAQLSSSMCPDARAPSLVKAAMGWKLAWGSTLWITSAACRAAGTHRE